MNLIDIVVARTIPARAEQVFDTWIDSKSPGGPWYGSERVIENPVVDGLFYISVKHEGRIWAHYGRFLKLDRARLIEYTWMSEATRGVESIVSITLEPRGEETQVTLRHSGVPDDEMGRRHEEGWTSILSALAQTLASRRSASATN